VRVRGHVHRDDGNRLAEVEPVVQIAEICWFAPESYQFCRVVQAPKSYG
jgi:hypothetical protein